MYEFISKDTIFAACDEHDKEQIAEERKKVLDRMRKEITEFLEVMLRDARTTGKAYYSGKLFRIPLYFLDKESNQYVFPQEINDELTAANFTCQVDSLEGTYYLL